MKSPLRTWRLLGLGMLAFATALWLTPSLWQNLDAWIQNQRDRVWERLETALGQKVTYDRIAPNFLTALDFQNVRLLADDGTPVLTAASIRFSWDWVLVFQGRFGEALRKIRFINATVHIDARRDAALVQRWTAWTGNGPPGFQLEAFNLSARWTDGVRSLALDRGFLTLSPKGAEWGLRFRGALQGEDRSAERTFASAVVKGELRSDPLFQSFSLRTEISQVATSWFTLEPLTLQITGDAKKVVVSKVADQIPLDVQADWDRSTGNWKFRGEAAGFRPSEFIRWNSGRLWNSLATGKVSGRFDYQAGGEASFEGRVSWPAGALPSPLSSEEVEASGGVVTDGPVLRFTGLKLVSSSLAFAFTGSVDRDLWLPDGSLRLDRWVFPGRGVASGMLFFTRAQQRVDFTGEQLRWNSLVLDNPEGWVAKAQGGWTFELRGPLDGTEKGALGISGTFDSPDLQWRISAKATDIPLENLRDEIRREEPDLVVPTPFWNLDSNSTLQLEGVSSTILRADASFSFLDPSRPERLMNGTLNWQNSHLHAALAALKWDALTASAVLEADFRAAGPVDWTLQGNLWDKAFSVAGRWDPVQRLAVFSGSPGIQGLVQQDPAGTWIAQVSLDPLEVVPGWVLGFQAKASLSADAWTVDADRVTFAGRFPWNQEAFFLQTRLSADATQFKLRDLSVADPHGTLAGSLESSWSVDFSRPWNGRLILATPDTRRETLEINWVGTGWDRWHFAGKTAGLDITRGGVAGLQGRLGLTGTLDWVGEERIWSVQAALSEALYGDTPLGFRSTVSGTNTRISVRNLNLSMNPIHISDGSLEVDSAARSWQASLGFGLRLGANDWQSKWLAGGTWNSPENPSRTDFRLKTQNNLWAKRAFPDWTMSGSWGESGWHAALADGGLEGQGGADGRFQIRAQAPFPVLGDADGVWKAGIFSLAVKGFHADLALVKEFINSKLFSVTAGEAVGDFTIGGALSDPDVDGSLVLKGLTAESSLVRHSLGPVDVPVVFQGHMVRIQPVNFGPSGQSWFVGGVARLDHLLPEEYEFSVETDALSEIPASYKYSGISATGNVNGLFLVKGNSQSVTLGGRLVLEDTTITLKDSDPAPEANSFDSNVDLTLVTGRKVEFLWPNQTLPLIQAVTAPGQFLVIHANQVASTWSMTGKLALKTGEINYLNRTFILKEGNLVFQENQSRFDPQVSLRADWRIQEQSGPVIIILRADGPLAKFSPRFESSPYMSPAILQQLVGTSTGLPSDSANAAGVDTALSLASDVGTSFLLTPLEETIRRNLGLDLFSVQTELLKRSFLNRNDSPNAVDYLDNTRLFFGKYIGEDLFLQGTLAFYQGVIDATQVSQVIQVDPAVEMDLQTPFFGLNWTLLLQHPNTYFVADNTVTLKWNWSY